MVMIEWRELIRVSRVGQVVGETGLIPKSWISPVVIADTNRIDLSDQLKVSS